MMMVIHIINSSSSITITIISLPLAPHAVFAEEIGEARQRYSLRLLRHDRKP